MAREQRSRSAEGLDRGEVADALKALLEAVVSGWNINVDVGEGLIVEAAEMQKARSADPPA